MSGKDERDPSNAAAEPATAADPAADPRKVILARRASFIAAAMVGIACGKTTATNEPPPMPCLSVAWVPEDAGRPADGDAQATSIADGVGGATDASTNDRDASTAAATVPAATDPDGGRRFVRPPQPVPGHPPAPCLSAPIPQRLPSKR